MKASTATRRPPLPKALTIKSSDSRTDYQYLLNLRKSKPLQGILSFFKPTIPDKSVQERVLGLVNLLFARMSKALFLLTFLWLATFGRDVVDVKTYSRKLVAAVGLLLLTLWSRSTKFTTHNWVNISIFAILACATMLGVEMLLEYEGLTRLMLMGALTNL